MDTDREQQAVVPFRHRHDGWTRERQKRFLERLSETGCVSEACRVVGLSTTSAYRAFARMPAFARSWDQALATRRPMLEDAAFARAINGVTVPLTRLGQVVGERRRYSDTLLRFMLEREDRRAVAAQEADHRNGIARATQEETDGALERRLDMLAERIRKEKEAKAITFDAPMTAEDESM